MKWWQILICLAIICFASGAVGWGVYDINDSSETRIEYITEYLPYNAGVYVSSDYVHLYGYEITVPECTGTPCSTVGILVSPNSHHIIVDHCFIKDMDTALKITGNVDDYIVRNNLAVVENEGMLEIQR